MASGKLHLESEEASESYEQRSDKLKRDGFNISSKAVAEELRESEKR